jgi:NAD(P)-dependent dehydrogenase (short-subunit alcohol dehydrogenase family)
MPSSLQGQRGLVTGSTAGIGHAIAEHLARAGAEVIINGRTPARVDEALRTLEIALELFSAPTLLTPRCLLS